ncbi:MAG TPA: BppU family phage baseplate upper protein [Syntrophomonas sp.]|nr:BppU family phage baseplate upper protein [Syntrophomonas sp.]
MITIKQGDRRNCIKAILKDSTGTPVDLTDCGVKFVMASISGGIAVNRDAHIEDAAAGEVWVVWAPGETDVAGTYLAEFTVTWPDGRKETYPNGGYIEVKILRNLRS